MAAHSAILASREKYDSSKGYLAITGPAVMRQCSIAHPQIQPCSRCTGAEEWGGVQGFCGTSVLWLFPRPCAFNNEGGGAAHVSGDGVAVDRGVRFDRCGTVFLAPFGAFLWQSDRGQKGWEPLNLPHRGRRDAPLPPPPPLLMSL